MTDRMRGPLALIGSEDREGGKYGHPVICETVTDEYPPKDELHLWREATDEEYAAYVAFWDDYYDNGGE